MRNIFAIGLTAAIAIAATAMPVQARPDNPQPVIRKLCFTNQTAFDGSYTYSYNNLYTGRRHSVQAQALPIGRSICVDAVTPADLTMSLTVGRTICRATRSNVTATVTVAARSSGADIQCSE